MNLSRTLIEQVLKKAIGQGELHFEFSDEDIEYLLARSEMVRPSKYLAAELEEILLNSIAERESVEMAVREETTPYGKSTEVDSEGVASCSVGEALSEELRTNGWTETQAAEKLGTPETNLERLLKETLTVSRSTARHVAGLLSAQYRLSGRAEEVLAQWLLNGLHFRKLRYKLSKTGLMRAAARKKKK